MSDVTVENHGTVMLFVPQTEKGREWIVEHGSSPVWFGGALACEPRYAIDLAQGMLDDGLEVE